MVKAKKMGLVGLVVGGVGSFLGGCNDALVRDWAYTGRNAVIGSVVEGEFVGRRDGGGDGSVSDLTDLYSNSNLNIATTDNGVPTVFRYRVIDLKTAVAENHIIPSYKWEDRLRSMEQEYQKEFPNGYVIDTMVCGKPTAIKVWAPKKCD